MRHLPIDRHASFREKTAQYMSTRYQYQFVRALMIGLAAGILALLFQYALWLGETIRQNVMEHLSTHWYLLILVIPAVTAIGALVAKGTNDLCPEAAGSGIPHVKNVLADKRGLSNRLLIPVKFIGGLLVIGAGFSLGREGPTVQMGAVAGSSVARFLKISRRERDHLIACGAGAGLAGAFNAPLAGFLFVIEEFGRRLSPMTYGTAFISSLTAALITQISLGQVPSFHIQQYPIPALASLPLFIILGVFAGLVGTAFNTTLMFLKRHSRPWAGKKSWKKGAVAGLLVGLALIFIPDITGGGHSAAETLLAGHLPPNHTIWFLLLTLAGKLLLTTICFVSGVPGGIFAPILLMGATLGSLVGHIGSTYFVQLVPNPAAFAVVGMAAIFVSSIRAPLTGIVLILEMTGNYAQLFPLSVSCLIAYMVSSWLRNPAIYDSLAAFDLPVKRVTTVGNSTVVSPRFYS